MIILSKEYSLSKYSNKNNANPLGPSSLLWLSLTLPLSPICPNLSWAERLFWLPCGKLLCTALPMDQELCAPRLVSMPKDPMDSRQPVIAKRICTIYRTV